MRLLDKNGAQAGQGVRRAWSRSMPALVLAVLGSIACLLEVPRSQAQVPTRETNYTRQSYFRIPFDADQGARRLREVQLWFSEDQGQSWQKYAAVAPEQRGFNFRAERDGLYWFLNRTVDFQGQLQPPTLQGAVPELKVCVDTQPPVVALRQGPARDGNWAVQWDIREANLDLTSFALDYRVAGSADWIPLAVEPSASGQRLWRAETNSPVEVRLQVRDLAGNTGDAKVTLSGGGQGSRLNYQEPGANPSTGRGAAVGTKWVNSKRISLNYKLAEAGPSGVSKVELWFTRDTRSWEKYNEEKITDVVSPDDPNHSFTHTFEVHDEGKYGFTLVPRSGVDLSYPPPRNGDQPQIWVEVDITPPVVSWLNVDVGRGLDTGTLTITWKATDKNLGREPIALLYRKDSQGQWGTIAAGLENSGRYVWKMPKDVPYSFFVRVDAVDLAGNVGSAETPKPVLVDLRLPKSLIMDAQPAGK